ncbi:MAG TPA: alpha-N-arabinofuranosidase [Solirubrobacteraceae bacterium]|nr:alpha-N-arabinofuranosidase [Solirubrobacteraceae bacterium]
MENSARMVIDPAFTVAKVDDRVFGSFVEHMGRAVYGGIYEPGHETADEHGFRGDVADLVRELGVTLVRYPGGNFVSAYDWEDGVGPRDRRPTKLDLAWRSFESNEVGTDEFMTWARQVGTEPMFAVNLGTRGIDAARNLVEYCNAPTGSRYADWRAENGHPDPYGIKLWCLGNEMDGPWQIGQKTAVEYGRIAAEAGKAMRLIDPTIELCVVGSSNSGMPTFGAWEDTVLDLAWNVADYVSLHTYYDPLGYPDLDAYLACSLDLDRMIDTVVATADAVAGRRRSRKKIGLSVDEWNIWHQKANPHHTDVTGPFKHAPALAEDDQTVADALVVGCLLITLLRHADRVKVACLAQLVNVIPPIRTLNGGPAWRQTTFFPFMHASRFGRGTVLRVEPEGPVYDVEGEGAVPVLETTAVLDAAGGALTVFAVNRGGASLPLEVVLRELDGVEVGEHLVLADDDLDAGNTAEVPDRVGPRTQTGTEVRGASLHAELPPRSWNVIRLHGGVLEGTA